MEKNNSSSRFGFKSGICILIAPVPVHCFSITFGISHRVVTWIRSFLSDRSRCAVLDGEKSDACPVLSGVPQGSVLGPCFFVIYINDMPETIKSNIRLFADDTIMYLTILNQSDCKDLQIYLTKLESWEREWLMAFNPAKCEIIRITKKKDPIIYDYKLHHDGLTLQNTKKRHIPRP